ncbi:calcium-translocating P-type ATPase, SERCA-type [Candidatus Caldatribacterium sp.]|uniref:calcium-translocating P-type ATPase, SERCA-type n=1 Tax=Candidatus Caldatribacterium sp. TaxID=2282143 RepID=UPI002998DD93|nr:calcium-translocating P-type ATPase, SERCA-type [Candidatus Caldatribacterium sp.]MDW8081215.1 calcium-translocating P-type ATPase, SERCA-type [Candidatus Calescibacterium sp.]
MAQERMSWHTLSPEEVAAFLGTSAISGLSQEEAERRLKEYGPNVLTAKKTKSVIAMFLEQFRDFLVLILLGAAAISLVLGETTDSLVIIAILVVNACLGVFQEYRAKKALEALKRMSVPECEVIRSGTPRRIRTEFLVPGDIVVLHEGDIVPADLRLVEVKALRIDEASLTGESVPVEKDTVVLPEETPLPERVNMAFAGTVVTYGRGKGIVVATGMDREIGRIASLLEEEEETVTPLQRRLAGLGKLLGLLTIGICALVFLVGFVRGEPLFEMFMTAVSLAVAAIPEGLPAVVTVVLALGVFRMSKHNAIVRKLPAVETLGCTTYICTDKTGTLTENRMVVRKAWTFGDNMERLLAIATLCNDAFLGEGENERSGDPTEVALLTYAKSQGFPWQEWRTMYPRYDEIPFDSGRKRMSTLHVIDGQYVLFTKGAPEILLERCSFYEAQGQILPLGEKEREQIRQAQETMASEALRVLAFAFRMLPSARLSAEAEQDLIFVGLLGMIDPPRKEVYGALAEAKRAGIETVMITGDSALTAEAIAKELGMLEPGDEILTGQELERLPHEELRKRIRRVRVFARVWPEQKLRIVEALQESGEVVAMTGDGVNDAPALKKADIGVAMGITGTDVAKEVADMVLADDNFATIVRAVKEGRVIFDNIRKFVVYLLSCNLGEIGAVFVPILLGLARPLAPVQILLVNLVTDGLPALALGVEAPEPDLMLRRPRHPKEGIITPFYMRTILFGALFITLAVVLAFVFGMRLWGLHAARTIAFVTLGLGELWRAYSFRSERLNAWRVDPRTNLFLLEACGISLVVILASVVVPVLRNIFDTHLLTFTQWMFALGFSLFSFIAFEVRKFFVRRDAYGSENRGPRKP